MKQKKVLFITQAAMIAALYVILTYLAAALGISSGVIQVRFSEALTILPFYQQCSDRCLPFGCYFWKPDYLSGCCYFL